MPYVTVVLIHGYPLNGQSWEKRERVLLEHLDLAGVMFGGFSMVTGEVTRYLGRYGSARVAKAVMVGVIPPFLLKTEDNPEGVDGQVFGDIKAAIAEDRYAYFENFLDNFYNTDKLAPARISNLGKPVSAAPAGTVTSSASIRARGRYRAPLPCQPQRLRTACGWRTVPRLDCTSR